VALQAQKRRELVFQALFALEFQEKFLEKEVLSLLMKEHKVSKRNVEEIIREAKEIFIKKEELDKKIREVSHSFDITRINVVEKTILRLSLWELLFQQVIPEEIVISEAKRIAKKFATEDAARFVHGIIDALYKEWQGKEG